jgi:hypothetical protein
MTDLRARSGVAMGLAGALTLGAACGSQAPTRDDRPVVGSTQQPSSMTGVVATARQIAVEDSRLSSALSPAADTWSYEGGGFVRQSWLTGTDGSSVGARMPADATGSFSIGLLAPRERLDVMLEGAQRVAPHVEEGNVVYSRAYASTDVVMTSVGGRFEELLLLRDATAPAEFGWRVGLSSGIAAARVDDDGGVTFVDGLGAGVLRVLPPYAIDATGNRREALLSWTAGRLTVSLDTAGLAYPVLLDPAVTSYIWTQAAPTTSPPLRDSFQGDYDANNGNFVIFSGVTCTASGCASTLLTDTWTWNGTNWTQMSPSTSPPPRLWAGMVFDSTRNVSVLYGGAPQSLSVPDFSDTWEWNGSNWTQKTTPANAGLRDQFALVYDPVRKVTVLFGGEECKIARGCTNGTAMNYGFTLMNDTWEYNGTTWTQVTTATAPSARTGARMVFDTARGVSVLFGGTTCYINCTSAPELQDTWEWNGTSWIKQAPAASPPPRDSFGFAYDTTRGVSVLFGGYGGNADTWEWDGTNWTQTTPAGSPSNVWLMPMAFDILRGRVVLFGGTTNTTDIGTTSLYYAHGNACTTGSQCDSGFCVDGVCCDTSSCATCQACNTATSPGTCAAVSGGMTSNCNGNKTCSAGGQCLLVVGQACPNGNGDCANNTCVDGFCCSTACNSACEVCAASLGATGNGTCSPATAGYSGNPPCGGYVCNGTSPTCPATCSSDANCATGYYCAANGTCQAQKAQGSTCSATAGVDCLKGNCRECSTGNCVDGVCCDSACNGSCQVCSTALGASANGTCTTAPAGYGGSPTCYPYLCSGTTTTCPTACTGPSSCATGAYCQNGGCQGTATNGQSCGTNAACVSHFCVDGVCCNSACTGQCEACDVAGSAGTCSPVAGSPHGTRAACPTGSTSDPCTEAKCDGNTRTSCTGYVGSSQSCRAASCTNGVATLPSTCDGMGHCPAPVTKQCSPYTCLGTSCGDTCTVDSNCAPGERCDTSTGKCVGGVTCDGNHTITGANGQTTDCSPYTCTPAGCQTSCQSVVDCVSPAICNASNQCVQPAAANGAQSGQSSGCTLSAVGDGGGAGAASIAAGLMALSGWARRRRRAASSRGGTIRR